MPYAMVDPILQSVGNSYPILLAGGGYIFALRLTTSSKSELAVKRKANVHTSPAMYRINIISIVLYIVTTYDTSRQLSHIVDILLRARICDTLT